MNNALYYPSIEFHDYEWLWGAALLWDRIYRIVPEGYEPDEPENVRVLIEGGEIGIPLRPGPYAKGAADEFLEKVESGSWDAAALVFDMDQAYARLHQDKVDVQLREMLIAKGKAATHNEWLHVPVDFEALYMTFLAEQMAQRNGLRLLSDVESAWSASTYFRYNGQIAEFPRKDCTHQLAVLAIRDFLPENILQLNPKDIVTFREKYRDERQRFVAAIQTAANDISACEDETVYKDRIRDLQKEIEAALADYKRSMISMKVVGWTGLKSVTFPVVTKVACAMVGKELDPTTLTIISGVGVALGIVSGFLDFRQKRGQLEQDSEYSYLLHLRRNWKACAIYGNDYNYLLCRTMEEFIND